MNERLNASLVKVINDKLHLTKTMWKEFSALKVKNRIKVTTIKQHSFIKDILYEAPKISIV